jgi:hypothetical protein
MMIWLFELSNFRPQTIRFDLDWSIPGASRHNFALFASLQVLRQRHANHSIHFTHVTICCSESITQGQSWWWQPIPFQTMMDSHLSTAVSRPAAPHSSGRSGVELLQWEENFVSCIQALFDSGCTCFHKLFFYC